MDITIADIKLWGTSSELDHQFDALFDNEPDFDDRILSLCDSDTLLEIAANRNAPKRQFFAFGLAERLVNTLYSHRDLPYEFSRFSGMISLEDYLANERIRLEAIYEHCAIVEKMRTSQQEEVKNIGNMILDFRHDRFSPYATTKKLIQLINYQIQQSFLPDTTTYRSRICVTCEDGFKSWVVSGQELQAKSCPFCKLKIQYPQRTGKNAR